MPGTRATFPCVATSSNALQAVEAEQVVQAIAHVFTRLEAQRRCGTKPGRLVGQPAREHHRQVTLDGKTLRGTLGHAAPDQGSQHLVALYETQTGIVLAQQAVPDKANEITLEATLLTPTQVAGRIVTADAMHTETNVLRRHSPLRRLLRAARHGQPAHRWREDLRLFFAEPPAGCRDWRQAQTCSKGHGRLERRELVASTELNEFLGATWSGVAQVFCLQRSSLRHGQRHAQIVYGITNLSPREGAWNWCSGIGLSK